MDQADRNGIEEVQLLAPVPLGRDEVGFLEHLQVLHHPEPRHVELAVEVGERAPVTLEEQVEQVPPARVGECLEDEIFGHLDSIGDQTVTSAVGYGDRAMTADAI